MNPKRWQRIKRLYGEALEHPEDQRREYVERVCGPDRDLADEVLDLLELRAPAEAWLKLDTPPPGDDGEDEVGAVLGDFELLEVLGRGGSGTVWRARQQSLDREVAVKVLRRPYLADRHRRARFEREVHAAARLRHDGIVPVIAVGRDEGSFWFAMELVEGHDLRVELERAARGEAGLLPAPGSPERLACIVRLVRDVARALDHAHRHGVVHRDVKPQNILLELDGQPRIADFGLARDDSMGSITRTGIVEGTPHYMSPEQARAAASRVDHRTDVYSLGVVLYELLTNCRPFEGSTSHEILSQITKADFEPVRHRMPGVPRALATVCEYAMRRRPEQRYRSAAAFADDLDRFLADEPIRATEPSLAERAERFLRRHPRSVATLATLALVAVTGWGVWRARDAAERRTWPLVTVAVRPHDPGQVVADATVRVAPLDGERGTVGAPRPLDGALLDGARLEPGTWRVLVSAPGFLTAELDRDLLPGSPDVELEAWLWSEQDRAEVEAGMLRFAPGTFAVPERDEVRSPCTLTGTEFALAPFLLDEALVSFGQYRAFLDATGRPWPAGWASLDPEELPADLAAVALDFFEMRAYAEWAGKRLVHHAEWEAAARGSSGRLYPDGDEPPVDDGRYDAFGGGMLLQDDVANRLARHLTEGWRVRAGAPGAAGLYGIHGGVWEMTASHMQLELEGTPFPSETMKVLVGTNHAAASTGAAGQNLGDHGFQPIGQGQGASGNTGFRCARSL